MSAQHVAPKNATVNPSAAATRAPSRDEQQAAALMERGQYDRAALVLANRGAVSNRLLNVRGVCLLRAGNAADAISLYRGLVLRPGSTSTRPNLPSEYRRNFATALLIGGLPSGCLDILDELDGASDETAQRLRRAVRTWAKSLGFWSRWNWRINRIEPKACQIPIDFVPGEFAPGDLWFDLPEATTEAPAASQTPPPRPAA